MECTKSSEHVFNFEKLLEDSNESQLKLFKISEKEFLKLESF